MAPNRDSRPGLAATRLLYPPPLVTAPAVLVIDIPPGSRGRGLALGRYYPIILETESEQAELEALLTDPVLASIPDAFDRRPSGLWSAEIMIARFDPPALGWPWVSLARWPATMVKAVVHREANLARGCYTIEMFDAPDALVAHQLSLLDALSAYGHVGVRLIAADSLPRGGHA